MKPVDNFQSKPFNNPYHTQQMDLPLKAADSDTLGTLRGGVEHEVGDLVRLELTAEQMVGDEVRLAREYVVEDSGHFWRDLKQEFVDWELATSQLLLSAADPTRVEWQESQWWGDEESQLRH